VHVVDEKNNKGFVKKRCTSTGSFMFNNWKRRPDVVNIHTRVFYLRRIGSSTLVVVLD
jgi:hypothetical protein